MSLRVLSRQKSATQRANFPTGVCVCHILLKRFASDPGATATHYEILGVLNTASVTDIKKAFRQKAKRAHPDAVGTDPLKNSKAHTFGDILTAYQVLTNARERQLYDLSIDPRTGRVARKAAGGDSQGNAEKRYTATEQRDDFGWVREDSWAAWAASAPAPITPHNEMDRLRAELRSELRSALRHAYLGPQLEVEEGQLPNCFEADERSDPAADDVLQLVSGRTVLGTVTERNERFLTGTAGELESSSLQTHTISINGVSSHQEEAPEVEGVDVKAHQWSSPLQMTRLQLSIGSHISAFGLRERSKGGAVRTSIFDAHGELVAVEKGGQLYKETKDFVWERGSLKSVHEVLRWRTPFVNHLQFVGLQGTQRLSICKARRARLPPSHLWIFPPRSQQHAERSWYVEWPGHGASDHPLWLPPSVFVLTAAFDGLDAERRAEAAQERGLIRQAAQWTKAKIGL